MNIFINCFLENILVFTLGIHSCPSALQIPYWKIKYFFTSICLKHFLSSIKYIDQFNRIKSLNTSDLDTIPKSIIFMRDNLTNKISLSQIVEHVGYSDSYFRSLFLEKTSFKPIEYLNKLNIHNLHIIIFAAMAITTAA